MNQALYWFSQKKLVITCCFKHLDPTSSVKYFSTHKFNFISTQIYTK